MFPLLSYFRFLLHATNEHGVHSPFVYSFLTQCLYLKPRKHPKKSLDVLLKCIPYFNLKNIGLPKGSENIEKLILGRYPGILINKPPYDLLYLPEPDAGLLSDFPIASGLWHDESLILVEQIHKDSAASMQWEIMTNLDPFRVSIDIFFCGLLFFRKGQAMQHFKIRI